LDEHGAIGARVDLDGLAGAVLERPEGPLALRVCVSGAEDGNDVADASLALGRGALFVDEADRWVDVAPLEAWIEHVERGRHYGVGLFLATRRPSRLWRTATANADVLIAFRTFEPRDVEYLRDYGGKPAAEALGRLRPFEHVRVDCRTGTFTIARAGRKGLPAPAEAPEAPAPAEAEERDPVFGPDDWDCPECGGAGCALCREEGEEHYGEA
jgi:hypothetical protein